MNGIYQMNLVRSCVLTGECIATSVAPLTLILIPLNNVNKRATKIILLETSDRKWIIAKL